MKIPFVQHRGIGLHITDRVIRWVQLSRIRQRICIGRVAYREVKSGDLQVTLKGLVEEIMPDFLFVTANIDPAAVDMHVLELPFIEDEEYLVQWIRESALELLPANSNVEDYAVTHHLFGDPEEGQRSLFVVTLKKAVRERVDLLESAGLKPVLLTTGTIDPGYTVMFDEDVTTGTTWLLSVFEDQSVLLHYRNGLLEQVHTLVTEETKPGEVLAEAESLVLTEAAYREEMQHKQAYLISGGLMDFELNDYEPENSGTSRLEFQQLGPLSHLEYKGHTLSPEFAVACGLALKQLYPSIDTLNLLEKRELEAAAEAIEKKDAMHTVVGMGAVVGILFLILMLFQWYLGGEVEKTDARVAALEDKITAVSEARNRVIRLTENVTEGKRLVAERTSTARILETLANALPTGLWLNELRLDATTGLRDTEIILYGFAWNDALVAVLLERFEQQKESRNVRLVYSEQAKTQDIYGDPSYSRRELVSFEVRINMNQKKLKP